MLMKKDAIKEHFLNELKIKPINKISVTSLCKNVSINRSTFYEYFLDIYDLLDKIEDDFIYESIKLSNKIKESDYDTYDITSYVLDFIYQYKDLLKVLVFKNHHKEFEDKINSIILDLFDYMVLKNYTLPNDMSTKEYKRLLVFLTAGYYQIYKNWIIEDCLTPKNEISNSLTTLSNLCIDNTLNKNI